ncbi:uncharacterized protein LOC125531231 isoform X2 [Triticum urartu]|uniref:uncharacterized protein LOC125531231 isoform X1 n=1 Tax=Triticum urartu TaxID=4572 RepID=UPI002043628C|nr:uncharacterized protein LOC125531231 isoform X1 [Triticum urartu]XP_048551595.1 uncharacterized protein LOC125531231 isoform X2 [Triticum urartu]
MASTEEQVFLESRNLSYDGAHHLDNWDYPEDPGDRRNGVEVAELHDQPARMSTSDSDPCEVARRALDLMFPREEDSDDCWSTWSAREEGSDDNDEQGGDEVDDCSTQESSDYEDDGNCHVILAETNCPGKLYPESEAEAIELRWADRFFQRIIEHSKLCKEIMDLGDDDETPFPPSPMKVFPEATALCILGAKSCHHRVYRTHDTSTTPSTLGYREPSHMLQFFSMRLSSFEALYPISVYGIFAIRDYLDRRRNYVFNRPRDDAVTIEKQDSFVVPLCSPCRGMYVSDKALVEVDLWVKKEGDESDDKQLLSAYAEIDVHAEANVMFYSRISGDNCNLDLKYKVLSESVEAVIQVYAKVDHPHHVRFTAFSTGYDDYPHRGVVLFDDKLFGHEKIFQHIVAVKANEELHVFLEVNGSVFQWTFQDEHVGAVISPDDSVFEYGQFFVRVIFAPKDCQ